MMTQTKLEKKFDSRINHAPDGFDAKKDLPEGFYEFLETLHVKFTSRQHQLVKKRAEVLADSHAGNSPSHLLLASEAAKSDWKIALPKYVEDQRNQMTGPADDAELMVKMLNSGAPGVMIDLEDSMANAWTNLERGIENSLKALHGELTYYDKKREREVATGESQTVTMIRVRGLHLSQARIFDDLLAASVYDTARLAFGVNRGKLKHNLTFYISKSESAEEALFWRDLFQTIERELNWERGFIKCFALVEAHPLAFQLEEFIYNLREHILGLNLGRWDYMASLIHFNLENPDWVLSDRNTIPSDVPFFQKLRELMVNVCHRRGILAIGGMTALFPNRADAELNERALKVLEADKKNEASVGMDGAWTGHPDQNPIAVAQFPAPNQAFVEFTGRERYPELRPLPIGVGKHTLDGTRAAARTAIRYRYGVLTGKGASLLDGYMEDLATDRIYRLMIAQRMKHRDAVKITDDTGAEIKHTPEFVTKIFDEELEKLLAESSADAHEKLIEARKLSEEMITKEQHDPI
jgi:malate synthase